MIGVIKRYGGPVLVGLLLVSCASGENIESPTVRNVGVLTHAGIMDEVRIGGSVTVSSRQGSD